MSSYANTNTPYTLAGDWFNSGVKGTTELGNKYPDNEAIGGLVAGNYADIFKTQANMGLSLGYNQAMSTHLADLTTNLENVKTGNSIRLMGAEGQIAKDLIGAQGAQQRLGIAATGKEQRLNIGAQGAQDRLNIGAQGAQDRLNIGAQGAQDRMNIRETGSEQRKGIVTAGQQERLNIGKRFQEERGMRADARGAIRSLGARFFG